MSTATQHPTPAFRPAHEVPVATTATATVTKSKTSIPLIQKSIDDLVTRVSALESSHTQVTQDQQQSITTIQSKFEELSNHVTQTKQDLKDLIGE